ncbi:MAG: hypothetical protein NTX45_14670 [Proteobacteria bacterium]|nr:hypothetical protein [Pseudomonadota bacterium]
MFKPLPFALFAGLILVGCQSKQVAVKPPAGTAQPSAQTDSAPIDQEWKPSTLSEQTIAKANASVMEYRKCLGEETKARAGGRGDPRQITNTILKNCEILLPAIKAAFDAENVPAVISERYMRKTRSHGAQSVLRAVMGVHAERAGEEAEAAANKP